MGNMCGRHRRHKVSNPFNYLISFASSVLTCLTVVKAYFPCWRVDFFFLKQQHYAFHGFLFPVVCHIDLCSCKWSEKIKYFPNFDDFVRTLRNGCYYYSNRKHGVYRLCEQNEGESWVPFICGCKDKTTAKFMTVNLHYQNHSHIPSE